MNYNLFVLQAYEEACRDDVFLKSNIAMKKGQKKFDYFFIGKFGQSTTSKNELFC